MKFQYFTEDEKPFLESGWDIKARRDWESEFADMEIPKGYKFKIIETQIQGKKIYSLLVKEK